MRRYPAHLCFTLDAFSRMIVGWRVAAHMRTIMVLDAMEMARWSRGTRLDGLRCHCDAGSRFMSVCEGERLAQIGAVPSIGGVGDSFDNALAETVNPACACAPRHGTRAHRRSGARRSHANASWHRPWPSLQRNRCHRRCHQHKH